MQVNGSTRQLPVAGDCAPCYLLFVSIVRFNSPGFFRFNQVTYILGLNAYHGDSSACLVKDGVLLAAAEEERFRRIKHWAGFPSMAIAYCLAEAGIALDEVGHVAINQDSGANLWKKLAFTLARRPDLGLIADRLKNRRERAGVAEAMAAALPGQAFRGKVHEVEHLSLIHI